MNIIPAILATTEDEYAEKISKLKDSGLFEGNWVQLDLMDNKFVQNKSVGSEIIAKYPANFRFETHLMVDYPEAWIDEIVEIGIDRIIFPVEDSEGVRQRIEHIKNHNIQVGLSINPETDIESLEEFVGMIDMVLVMGVEPGFSGQEFIPEVLDKVKEIKEKGWGLVIEVDGGVNEKNASDLIGAGADNLVVGSHLFEGDIVENVKKLKESIQGSSKV